MLIGATATHLGNYFSGILLEYSQKVFKKIFINILKFLCAILLRFVLKICQKYVIFKVLQVFLLLKSSGYMDITLVLKV